MQNKGIELLVFSAPWCSGCGMLKQKLDDKQIEYTEVNVDEAESESLVAQHKIRALPTTIGLKNGEVVLSMMGAGAIVDILELME